MTQQFINVGAAPNDGLGDPLRTAFIKSNENFTELYNRAQTVPPPTMVGSPGDEPGMYAYEPDYFYYCFSNYTGNSNVWNFVPAGGNLTTIYNGNSNVSIPVADGNVITTVNGSQVSVVDTDGLSITGNVILTDTVTSVNSVSTTSTANSFVTSGLDNLIISNTTIATANSNIYLDPSMDGSSVTGNVIILGNLSVAGNVTYIDVTTSYTSNLLWVAAETANSNVQADTAGLAIGPIGSYYASWRFNQPANSWVSDIDVTANGNVFAGGVMTSETGLFMNPNTLVGLHTIPTGYNAMSAGPMTIPPGSNVIVPPGSAWTVV